MAESSIQERKLLKKGERGNFDGSRRHFDNSNNDLNCYVEVDCLLVSLFPLPGVWSLEFGVWTPDSRPGWSPPPRKRKGLFLLLFYPQNREIIRSYIPCLVRFNFL
ncbi:hypothetical protein NE237_027260 [Protea cynaroides]|uniref:Uncharacterized protein n=1 Tax=Protea cynaroides TaxID=273540 RepID=A0A9Q0GML9_9MAGN|nr:hypothetical protein NE237_027260 [Protea cynaroides]